MQNFKHDHLCCLTKPTSEYEHGHDINTQEFALLLHGPCKLYASNHQMKRMNNQFPNKNNKLNQSKLPVNEVSPFLEWQYLFLFEEQENFL